MTENMGVCLLNDSFPPVVDGVANVVLNYAEILQREHGGSIVVTPNYPDAKDEYEFPVVRLPSFDTTKLVGYRTGFPFDSELLKRVSHMDYGILHCHCPMTSQFAARMLRQMRDVPLVFTYHTKFDIDIANAIRGKALQKGAERVLVENIAASDEVWVVSRGAGENLRGLGYTGDYVVMENGVDVPRGRVDESESAAAGRQAGVPDGVPLFLYVGRLMWYKGFRLTLDALAALKAAGRDFRFAVVGGGQDREEIVAYAEKLGLGSRCLFLGTIYDRRTLRAWYCRADLLLFPSTFDTNGLVVREAAACGLAAALVRGSCAAEGVTDGRNGVLVDELPGSMAAALLRLMDSPESFRRLGQAAMDELYISWEDSVARAYERYGVVRENWRRGHRAGRGGEEVYAAFAELSGTMERFEAQGRERVRQLKEKARSLQEQMDRYM